MAAACAALFFYFLALQPPEECGAAVLVLRGLSCGSLEALDAAFNRNLWAHERPAKRCEADFAFSVKPAS